MSTPGTLSVNVVIMLPDTQLPRTIQVVKHKWFSDYDAALEYWRDIQRMNQSVRLVGTYAVEMPE